MRSISLVDVGSWKTGRNWLSGGCEGLAFPSYGDCCFNMLGKFTSIKDGWWSGRDYHLNEGLIN